MDIELRELRYALAVARHGSYTRAAEVLGLTQPALSRAIRALERSLGTRLFDRGRHGAELTPSGAVLIEQAERVLDEAEELERRLRARDGQIEGELTVTAGSMASLVSVAAACSRLACRHPALRLRLVTTASTQQAVQDVVERRSELAVIELSAAIDRPELDTEELPRHRSAFVCRAGHPLTERPAIDLAQILHYPFAGPPLTARVAEMLSHAPTEGLVVIDPDTGEFLPRLTVDTLELALRVVEATDAVTGTPLVAVTSQVESGRLTALPFFQPWMETRYGFILRHGRTRTRAAEALMTEIRALEDEAKEREKHLLGELDSASGRSRSAADDRGRASGRGGGGRRRVASRSP